jgi:ribosomal protein L15
MTSTATKAMKKVKYFKYDGGCVPIQLVYPKINFKNITDKKHDQQRKIYPNEIISVRSEKDAEVLKSMGLFRELKRLRTS